MMRIGMLLAVCLIVAYGYMSTTIQSVKGNKPVKVKLISDGLASTVVEM